MEKLDENLTFNYDDSFYKDVNTIDGLMKNYLADRKSAFNEMFLQGEYSEDDIGEYLDYFTKHSTDLTQDTYPDLYHIHHFLERDYEIYIQDDICDSRNDVVDLMMDCTDENGTDGFEDREFERLEKLENAWKDFKKKVADIPVIDLAEMDYEDVYGVQCYFSKTIQDFVKKTFSQFMKSLHDDYPNVLLKLDSVLVVPKDYIQFLGGDDSTQAFFTDNSLFLADSCDDVQSEEEKVFFKTVLFHEFGHFIFSLMSETSQIYWADLYREWREKGTPMTRDDDRNSQLYDEDGNESGENVEELFADTFACHFVGDEMKKDFYIHRPSALISSSQDFILKREFV